MTYVGTSLNKGAVAERSNALDSNPLDIKSFRGRTFESYLRRPRVTVFVLSGFSFPSRNSYCGELIKVDDEA